MKFTRGFYKGFKNWGLTLSTIINTALLLIVYLFGVGISSGLAKVLGKHFLELRPKGKSYWRKLELTTQPLEHYYRQF